MFNNAEIKEVLFGRMGWRDSLSPVSLSEKNKEARSSRYFQDTHGAITLTNIYDNIEEVNAREDSFNKYLEDLQYSAILNSLNGVFNENTLIEQSLIFNRDSERRENPKSNPVGKVGYKISVSKDASYSCMIRTLSLLFAGTGTINVVLQHNTASILYEKTVEVEDGKEVVVSVDWPLYYTCDKYKGGFFYLYYESSLVPIDFTSPGFNKTYMFRAEPSEGESLEDLSFSNKTYGLNAEICSYRDFTEVIKRNEYVFDTIIGLQMAANVIELILNSTRSNKTERISKNMLDKLYNDLNIAYSSPEFPYTTGIRNQIAREIKRLKENLLPKGKVKTLTPCFT
ncbi:hypothetical protein M2459_001351 [Parabacteroides sp. PF5-5]|uniref:hypothetical protein n=1 Tax=unclassified Parabacteroides TaxID=2649774 RepID=UPI0024734EEE|nr:MULTISPECIES: hypothetical protein [unclassified Parabacteroides]MDH6304616.1 hypothetical protein [Parabacteroides sp. PH5-39]MDH6315771.1 hypothetical protein [Parabacteroides sp. PF5-13]MDH6319430.1 hypothetical protein [Parabacteroides sp. PH5-13]MDH6323161.1 hypothetical protein [Parabacteroides sp. PH5-8]MDH6326963.1 hypothetical protein [Parabacteroides sp. PH5-41]